jgi:hypothetical protein
LRHGEAERLGSFQVEDQREFRRLLNREVGWIGTAQNAI